jgi:tetratricopeptide (TPR) repeat protein
MSINKLSVKILIAVIFCLFFLLSSNNAKAVDFEALPFKVISPGIKAGKLAPEFSFQDASGKLVSLSDYRGKKVFIFSWSSWCRCKYQLPEIEKFYRTHKSDNFEVITIASDSQGFKWAQEYLDLADATFIALIDPGNIFPGKYNCVATENGWLIDENGVVRMNTVGFSIANEKHKKTLLDAMKADFSKMAPSLPSGESVPEKIKALEDQVKLKPRDIASKLELSELYRQTGKLDLAEVVLEETLKIRKLSAEANYRLGVVLYQKGEIEQAVEYWKKAFKLEPTSYLYMRNIQAYEDPERFYAELNDKE